jgi:hypothetical protein
MREKRRDPDSCLLWEYIADSLIPQSSLIFPQVFNRLMKLFESTLRNEPETIVEARRGTLGSIQHTFKIYGATAILFIEVRFKVGNEQERMKFIAQVIDESDRKLHALMATPI